MVSDDSAADQRIDRHTEQFRPSVRGVAGLAGDVVLANRRGCSHVDDGQVRVSARDQHSLLRMQPESERRVGGRDTDDILDPQPPGDGFGEQPGQVMLELRSPARRLPHVLPADLLLGQGVRRMVRAQDVDRAVADRAVQGVKPASRDAPAQRERT